MEEECPHLWNEKEEPNPRFQRCVHCTQFRWRIDNLNSGEVGRTYWNLSWSTYGARYNTYPLTYARILSQIKPEDKVMDVGCGTGPFARVYREKFTPESPGPKYTIHGIDISQVAIDICTRDILEFYGYVCDFPLECPDKLWANYDIVVATGFLEHVTDEKKAALGLAKLCKDSDSFCFISVPDEDLPPEQEFEHARMFTMETLVALLEKYFKYVQVVRIKEERKLLAICTDKEDTSEMELHG